MRRHLLIALIAMVVGPLTLLAVLAGKMLHDEEDLVTACLQALVVAMDAVDEVSDQAGAQAGAQPGLEVRCTLVLDACTDRTADRAAPFLLDPRFRLALTGARNVGVARHLGITLPPTATAVAPTPAEQVWVLCTDADTVVPPDWIVEHLRLAATHDLVVGAVRPEAQGLSPALSLELARSA